jgi:hypothetical protein
MYTRTRISKNNEKKKMELDYDVAGTSGLHQLSGDPLRLIVEHTLSPVRARVAAASRVLYCYAHRRGLLDGVSKASMFLIDGYAVK